MKASLLKHMSMEDKQKLGLIPKHIDPNYNPQSHTEARIFAAIDRINNFQCVYSTTEKKYLWIDKRTKPAIAFLTHPDPEVRSTAKQIWKSLNDQSIRTST